MNTVSYFSNPVYFLSPLVVGAICSGLIVLVLLKGRRTFSTWLFCCLLFSIASISLFIFGMRSSVDVDRAVAWDRGIPIFALAAYVFYYHFALAYTHTRVPQVILYSIYSLLAIVAVLAPLTDLFVKEMRLEHYGYAPVIGPLIPPLSIIYLLLVGGGVWTLFRRYRFSKSYDEKNRLAYLALAGIFPLVGGILDAFSPLPPVGLWSNLAFAILCTVVILKYHLLDINVVAHKSLVYLLTSILVAVPFVGLIYLPRLILPVYSEVWWFHGLVVLVLAILLKPLYSWAQQIVDRLFYRGRYDYLKALRQFSQQAQSVKNLEQLASNLVQLVKGALQTSSACLLLQSEYKQGLYLIASSGLENPPSGIVLAKNNRIMQWLRTHEDILFSEHFAIIPLLQSLPLVEKNNLDRMRAKVFIPINASGSALFGILVLDNKLSEQPYSSEDKQLLATLSSQMAMALENARLYNDAVQDKENFDSWLNSMTDCVLIVNTDCTLQFMNRAAIKAFGDRIGNRCWYYQEKDPTCANCSVQHDFQGSQKLSRYNTRIGDREYDVAVTPFANTGGSTSFIKVLRDITEQRKLEEGTRQMREELQHASRLAAIGELAAGVAHEINNPLTGITGYSQLLLDYCVDEKTMRGLKKINSEGWRAAKVVENLLTFARRGESKKEYSNINEILQKTLELKINDLKTTNIQVVTEFDFTIPEILADFQQIEQVFLNIIINAEQAMTGVNNVRKFIIKTRKHKGYISTIFIDNGPGISAEHMNKLFDPFFTTKAKHSGTGLGLSICHGIISEHGGKICVKSKPGEGATFIIKLPIRHKEIGQGKVKKDEDTGKEEVS